MFIGFTVWLNQTLAPAGRSFRTNAPLPRRGIMRVGYRLFEFLSSLNPRHNHTIGADIENSFDQATIQFRNPDQSHCITPNCRPDMFENFLPIKVAVLSVNHDPIQS